MSQSATRGVREGLGFGIVAGIIFAAMEMAGAAMMGNSAFMPLRSFASIVLGRSAMDTTSLGSVLLVGIIVHLALSAGFGLVYGLVNAMFSQKTETSWGRQVGPGLLFGAMIWLINFQMIARLAYPWFLAMPQFLQMLMHGMFFGLPLALMYAAAERRVQHAQQVPGRA
jgi:uncharacterized membrane protein YagU involved in acid resistance